MGSRPMSRAREHADQIYGGREVGDGGIRAPRVIGAVP